MLLDLASGKKREVELIFRLQIVEDEVGKVGDEDKTRNIQPAIFAGEVFDVGKGLGRGLGKVFAAAFVFHDEASFPEKVDARGVAVKVADVFLKRSERGPSQAEDSKEVVPERLLVTALRGGFLVVRITSKANGAVANFVPGKMRHG